MIRTRIYPSSNKNEKIQKYFKIISRMLNNIIMLQQYLMEIRLFYK